MKHPNALAAKVAAVNSANKYRNEIAEKWFAFFAPLDGQKVLKADGAFLQKIAESFPVLPNSPALSVYQHSSRYSLCWVVKACELYGEHSCIYHESALYIANFDGAILKNMHTFEPARCDYTVAEVQNLRDNLRAARKALNHAESALGPFGEYDR